MRVSNKARALGLAFVLLTLGGPALGRAQDSSTALARSLFNEGVELADRERWEEASDRFRRSLAVRDSTVVAFNLATALTHTGHLLEASELFRRAARDTSAPAALREAAQRGLSEVEPRLGQLTVRLLGPQDRLTLRLDELDWPLAVVGVAAPADPGPHVVHALRDDHEVARAEVRVPEGGAAQVELTIPPLPAVTPGHGRSGQPVVPPPGGDVTGEAWFWILIGGGVAAVGAAVTILLVVALSGTGSPVAGNLMPGVLEFGG